MSEEQLVLVDADDGEIGVAGKLRVHREGLRHRAFSVYLMDDDGRVLLQRRAEGKYHSGGLWANACCGHPRPGESTSAAAVRRTVEELGVECRLRPLVRVAYRLDVGGGLVENEVTQVYAGRCRQRLRPDPAEVMAVRWLTLDKVTANLVTAPETCSVWFREVFPGVELHLRQLLDSE